MNERKTIAMVAKLIGQIHRRAPRQDLSKLTAADAEQALTEIDAIATAEESRKVIDARACDRIFGAQDLRKNYATADADSAKALARIHEQGNPVIGPNRAVHGTRLGGVVPQGRLSKAMIDEINKRFDHDRKE